MLQISQRSCFAPSPKRISGNANIKLDSSFSFVFKFFINFWGFFFVENFNIEMKRENRIRFRDDGFGVKLIMLTSGFCLFLFNYVPIYLLLVLFN